VDALSVGVTLPEGLLLPVILPVTVTGGVKVADAVLLRVCVLVGELLPLGVRVGVCELVRVPAAVGAERGVQLGWDCWVGRSSQKGMATGQCGEAPAH